MKLLQLAKLRTSEDERTQQAIVELGKVDDHAAQLVLVGALLNNVEGHARLSAAIESLGGRHGCGNERCEDIARKRETVAYFIGLAVGLRLAPLVEVRS